MVYVFGEYVLDTKLYELSCAGQCIKLEPRAFNVLLYLVQHRDRVVGKQELLEHLWPQRFVSDAALIRSIREIRLALGDRGNTQRMVRTLYGRGYRFVAHVEEKATLPRPGGDGQAAVLLSPPLPPLPSRVLACSKRAISWPLAWPRRCVQ